MTSEKNEKNEKKKRNAAAHPKGKIRRPRPVSPDGLTVKVTGEDGEDFGVFDFSGVEAPPELLRALVAGFARATGSGGRWRQRTTVENGAKALRRFAKDIAAVHPDLVTIADVTPTVWTEWREAIESAERRSSTIWVVHTLLRNSPGLPDTTRMATYRSVHDPGPLSIAYSRNEAARIYSAARRIEAAARSRIGANTDALARYRAAEEPEDCLRVWFGGRLWSPGEIVDHLSRTGELPEHFHRYPREAREPLREALGLAGPWTYKEALFPTRAEIYALMIMFAFQRGLNASVLARLKVGDAQRADIPGTRRPVYVVQLRKPRRGRGAAASTITLVGRQAQLWERAVAQTQSTRDTLAAVGHPTDQLLVACATGGGSTHPTGLFITDWIDAAPASAAWHKLVKVVGDNGEPLRVSLQRLRKTEQVHNGESRQNTADVSENRYRKNDPQTRARARATIEQGLTDALEHAEQTIVRRISAPDLTAAGADPSALSEQLAVDRDVTVELIDGRLDTGTAACLDIAHSPHEQDAGGACTASFLYCLMCPNAVVMPKHIPGLVALRRALLNIARSVPDAVREKHYAPHIARLDSLLGHLSELELNAAEAAVTAKDIETIERLLQRKLDV